jgi:hypothetical protein
MMIEGTGRVRGWNRGLASMRGRARVGVRGCSRGLGVLVLRHQQLLVPGHGCCSWCSMRVRARVRGWSQGISAHHPPTRASISATTWLQGPVQTHALVRWRECEFATVAHIVGYPDRGNMPRMLGVVVLLRTHHTDADPWTCHITSIAMQWTFNLEERWHSLVKSHLTDHTSPCTYMR